MDTQSSLVVTLSRGAPKSNRLCLCPVVNQSIELWLTLLQKFLGLLIYLMNFIKYLQIVLLYYVTTIMHFFSMKTRSCTNRQNILIMIIILFKNWLCLVAYTPVSFLHHCNYYIFSRRAFHTLCSNSFVARYVFESHLFTWWEILEINLHNILNYYI